MLPDISAELIRIHANNVRVSFDEDFEPAAGELLRVQVGDAYWHLLPEQFLELLRQLPDCIGADAVHRAIEEHAPAVWHGPAPPDARDTAL